MVSASAVLTRSYDYGEVARSVLIAIVASYAALDLAGRVTAARGRVRLAWLSSGAVAMGIGIWAMHFKGMLAFHLPVPIEYHWPTVLASLLVAILASAVALYVASRQKMGPVEALTGSVVMGVGIAGMHCTGMAAMRMAAVTRYSPLLVTCSVLLAVLFSLIALLMAFDLREETRWSAPRRLGSAIVMGAAIAAMHYTGMAAATFFPVSPPDLSLAVSIPPVGNNAIAIVTMIVLVAAMVTASLDRRQSEEHLRLVIDTTPAMLESVRPDGYGDFFNKHALEYVGLSLNDMCSWGWTRVIHPEDVEAMIGKWRSCLETGEPFETEARVRRADGEYRWMLHRKVPLRDPAGSIVKWYGSSVDIEDRRRAEEHVRQAQEDLARVTRLAALGELAAAIAHEVNQPLGAVVTNGSASLHWLAGQPPNLEEAREAIERTVREANRASEVIRRIRALLQKGPPQMERLDVNPVIREVLTLAGNDLLRSGVAVQTELASDVPNVFGDRVQLQQVLLNLILNGVDAMSTITDRPRELLVKSSRHANSVLIQVQDSGEGVEPKQADRIFDPFFSTKPQGIGMGLSISRSIVETHGGRLWFTPGSPHGVVFQFIVPEADTSDERAA